MINPIVKTLVLACMLASAFIPEIGAQDTISPGKRALIKELLTITEADKIAENAINANLLQMEKDFPQLMAQIISQAKPDAKDLKGAEREEAERNAKEAAETVQKEAAEFFPRFIKRYKELLAQRVNLPQVTEQVSYPLYDKYYTEDELKDLIAFYKSPTGKKAIKVMPQLMQESVQKWSELILPTLTQIVNEIVQEEIARFRKK